MKKALRLIAMVSWTVPLWAAVSMHEPTQSVRVRPNPWRADQHAASPQMTFDQLPDGATIKIFTISAHEVRTLASSGGSAVWDLKNGSGDNVASGIYLYLVSSPSMQDIKGKLAVIR